MNKDGFDLRMPKSVHIALFAAGGFAVLLFAAVAAATSPTTDWFQGSDRPLAAAADQPRDAEDRVPSSQGSESGARVRCAHCGIIESIRQVGTVREVTVRLADRSTHIFSESNTTNWRPGERIILIGGGNSPRR